MLGCQVHTYCLMSNHLLLVAETHLPWAEGSLMKRVDLYSDPGPERKWPVCCRDS